jgi:hypothetical protein
MIRYKFTRVSLNAKTGPIPVVMISRKSCPPSCPLYESGCYARGGNVRIHWDRVDDRGDEFKPFLEKIKALPLGQVWRYAVAGDLPGEGEKIDGRLLNQLVAANTGRKGFTYTHKKPNKVNLPKIVKANAAGFTINLSSNNAAQADEYSKLPGSPPVVTLIPAESGDWRRATTPEGRLIVRCPSEYSDQIQCINCGGSGGPLCARKDRRFIIGFTAHGVSKAATSRVARPGLTIIP